MTRALDSSLATALAGPVVRGVLLADFYFDSGRISLWNGIGDLVVSGITYTGGGTLLSISDYQETAALEAQGFSFTLSGISSSVLSLALAEIYQGRLCTLALGALDAAGIIIGSPYILFTGLMDTMALSESGETCTVTVSAENKMVILSRTKNRLYTDQDQQAVYPDDKGLEFVAALADRNIVWSAKS